MHDSEDTRPADRPSAQTIIEALHGRGNMARCPAHEDKTPSLSVRQDADRVLVHCHAGCSQDAVIAALQDRGLWPKGRPEPFPKLKKRPATGRGSYVPHPDDPTEPDDRLLVAGQFVQPGAPPWIRSGVFALLNAEDPAAAGRVLTVLRDHPEWPSLDPVHRQTLAEVVRHPGCAGRLDPISVKLLIGYARGVEWVDPPDTSSAADPLAGLVTLDVIGRTEPADVLARGLLWRGKMGVLHGGAGSGKSTLAAGVLAAVTSGGSWMGHPTAPGGADVLVLSGEDVDTLRARVDQWGGDSRRIHVWPEPDLAALPTALEKTGAGVVVVDSLQSLARGMGANLNDDTEAGGLVRGLAKVARDTGAAVLVLHHEPWAQGREKGSGTDTAGRVKGSGEIAAAADYTLRCSTDEVQRETTIEPTKRRHSINAERLVFLLEDDGYAPAPDDGPRGGDGGGSGGGRRPTADRILIHLARASVDAGPSRGELSRALGVRRSDVTEAVSGLLDAGLLRATGAGRRSGVGLTEDGAAAGQSLIASISGSFRSRPCGNGGNGGNGNETPLTVPTVPLPIGERQEREGVACRDQAGAVSEGPAVEPGGDNRTMTHDQLAAMRADTEAMADDWAAGGQRADSRMRDNALRSLNATVPDWESRAASLNLDGDLMRWTEDDWARVAGRAS